MHLEVVNSNDAPVSTLDPITMSSGMEGQSYGDMLDGTATDEDGEALSYSLVSGPSWLSLASDGTLSGTPGSGDVGVNSFSVKVEDAVGASDVATLNITVDAAPNYAPSWNADPFTQAAASEGVAYSTYVNWRVTDAEGDALFYSKVSGPAWLTMTNAAFGLLEGTPAQSDVGTNVFVVSVSDGVNAPVLATMQVTVTNVNDAPVFSVDPIIAANAQEFAAYSASLAGSASDLDGDALTYSLVSGPAWLSVAGDGTLSGQPSSSDVGLNSFTVEVSDGTAAPVSATLEITVDAAVWVELAFDDFESGWGNWLDLNPSNNDVVLSTNNAIGNQCVDIADNSGDNSAMELAQALDLSASHEVRLEFSDYAVSMDSMEDFWLQYSSDGGATWTTLKAWVSTVDFSNNVRYNEMVLVDGLVHNLSSNAKFRFQCDASGSQDDVYIDDIRIEAK
jgi:hypothetical protein